jgi:predicted Zn-dependent protease
MQANKISQFIFQSLLSILLFATAYLSLSKVDWVRIFDFPSAISASEQKTGEILSAAINEFGPPIEDQNVVLAVDSIIDRVCLSNSINPNSIQLHIISKEDVNAFAMPGGHLVLFTGLINECRNSDELAGVLCHEIAHIRLNHTYLKLTKEIGIAVISSIAGGSGGPEAIKLALETISSTAYDRSLESEADSKAVELLVNADIDPIQLSIFLEVLSKEENASEHIDFISTHPNLKKRSGDIHKKYDSYPHHGEFYPALSNEVWKELKRKIEQIQYR